MNFCRLLASILCTILAAETLAASLGIPADRPFRTYSVEDGLNQKAVTALTQDADGFIWVATFGGLNRFDGQTFTSFATRQGLRQNLIQHLMVDSQNQVCAGDVGGGLTVIKNGVVTAVYEPVEGSGVVRDTAEVGDTMYIAMQPGGLRQLALNEPDAVIEPVAGATQTIYYVVPRENNELIAVTENYDLLSIRILSDGNTDIRQIGEDIHAVQSNGQGQYFVGSGDGRVGELVGEDITWYAGTYPAEVSGLSFDNGKLAWVFTERHGMSRFGEHGGENLVRADWSTPGMVDAEGVLWVATRAGLARYLGERFSHYSLKTNNEVPDVFAIEPGRNGDFWLGTSLGILRATGDGEPINVSDALGLERREVRDVIFSPDGNTLYAIVISGQFYAIDLANNTARSLLDGERRPLISLISDDETACGWAPTTAKFTATTQRTAVAEPTSLAKAPASSRLR